MKKSKKDNKTGNSNKIVMSIVTAGLLVLLAIVFTGGKKTGQSVEIREGVQYLTINAGGGYNPNVTEAKGGIPTKLLMKTNGVFDCSSSLVIRSIGFQEILPQTGETEIDLGIPKAGVPLEGVCGMGMYSFQINFI